MNAIRWFETHAHLSDAKFDGDREETVARAIAAGVAGIVEIADGPTEWAKARELAERHSGSMWWAGGLHPYYADQSSPAVWAELERLAADPRFVAVGEIGLDYTKCQIPRDVQLAAFEEGLALADRLKKPVVIHCREAYADLMPLLRARAVKKAGGAVPGVVHCFSGNAEQALDAVPVETFVLETDSPYLPPQSRRGQRNEPGCLPEIGARLAALKRRTPAEAADIWLANARRLYRLPSN